MCSAKKTCIRHTNTHCTQEEEWWKIWNWLRATSLFTSFPSSFTLATLYLLFNFFTSTLFLGLEVSSHLAFYFFLYSHVPSQASLFLFNLFLFFVVFGVSFFASFFFLSFSSSTTALGNNKKRSSAYFSLKKREFLADMALN